MTVPLVEVGYDSNTKPAVVFPIVNTVDDIVDGSGNYLTTTTAGQTYTATVDGAAPVAYIVETGDYGSANGGTGVADGYIDGYKITFSEPIAAIDAADSLKVSGAFAVQEVTAGVVENTMDLSTAKLTVGASTLINLLFTRYYVPKGAKLFIYNSNRTSKIGAFTEQNNNEYLKLPTAPVYGDEIIVEYQEPANAAFSGQLAIGEVNHDYRGVTMRSRPGALSSTQTCHKDVACYPDYSEIAQATTLLIIGGNEFCTGCLVNNVEQDGTPYLLSAAHCFLPKNGATSETRAQNTVIFFNYQDPSCSNVIIGSEEYSLASAELLINEKSIDVALLRLAQMPPEYYRPFYSGWNANTPASAPYFCLHHPMSKTTKVAIENDNISLTTFNSSNLDYTIE